MAEGGEVKEASAGKGGFVVALVLLAVLGAGGAQQGEELRAGRARLGGRYARRGGQHADRAV